jgi:hypothetical protein
MRRLITILFLLPLFLSAQITYFNSASTPADNGTSATSPVAFSNPPIASMAAGDLVIVYAYCRNSGATIAVSNAGGQSWTSEAAHQSSTATLTGQVFWCRYNGTWSGAPSFSFSSTTNTNVVMHVFRPITSTNHWNKDPTSGNPNTNKIQSFLAGATIAGNAASFGTINANTVSVQFWATDDDNTWGSLTGSGWTSTGNAQYRNTSGNDVSSTYAHSIRTSAGTVSQPTKTEATNGNDPGIIGLFTWYEYTPSALPRRVTIVSRK